MRPQDIERRPILRLPPLDDSLFRLLQLNAAFATALGRVTAEFLGEVAATLNQSRLLPPLEPRSARMTRGAEPVPQPPPALPTAVAPPERAAPMPSIMLLEAEAGRAGLGFFLVENTLPHEVAVRVEASPYADPPAAGTGPQLTFYPEVVNLAPHEQITMRVMAAIDDTLEPDVRYRCDLTVPALPGTRIPVVIRRRPSQITAKPRLASIDSASGAKVRRKRRSA